LAWEKKKFYKVEEGQRSKIQRKFFIGNKEVNQ